MRKAFCQLGRNSFIRYSMCMSTAAKPAWCSKLPRPEYSSLERISNESQAWFEIYRIQPNIFALYEPYHWEETISYLVVGAQRSLLIDSGMGIGNIRKAIEPIMPKSKPLSLINTHTHHDHIGDNWQFQGKIIGVLCDFAQRNARGSIEEAQNELGEGMIWESHLPKDFIRENYRIFPFEINQYVDENDRIDLGNDQQLTIIKTPGHSPDSISLFDEKNRLLFVGDVLYPGQILLYRPETNLNDYLETLEKLAEFSEKFDILLPGHNVPTISSKLLIKAAESMRRVMKGNVVGKPIHHEKYLEYDFQEFSFVIDPKFFKNKN